MFKLRRILAMVLSAVMGLVVLTGCTEDEIAYLSSLQQSSVTRAGETTTAFVIDIYETPVYEGTGWLADMVRALYGLMGEFTFSGEHTFVTDLQNGMFAISSHSSADTEDLSLMFRSYLIADENGYTQIFRIPTYIRHFLPGELQGMEYFYMQTTAAEGVNFASVSAASDNVQAALFELLNNYAATLRTSNVHVTRRGLRGFDISINDDTLKTLIREIVIDYTQSEESRKLVRQFVLAYYDYMLAITPTFNDYITRDDINRGFDEFEATVSSNINAVHEFLDTLDGIRILGPKGITASVTIDRNGFITTSNSVVDINIDIGAVSRISNPNSTTTGGLGMLITQNMQHENINRAANINMPTLTAENSFSMERYLEVVWGSWNTVDPWETWEPQEPNYTPLEYDDIWIEFPSRRWWNDGNDHDRLVFENRPFRIDGVTYVHLEEFAVFAPNIMSLTWDDELGIFWFASIGAEYSFTPGTSNIFFTRGVTNGEIHLSHVTLVVDGKTYVPLSSFWRMLDRRVEWDAETDRIYLY